MQIRLDSSSAWVDTVNEFVDSGRLKPKDFADDLILDVSDSVRLLKNGDKTPFSIDYLNGKMRWRLAHLSKKKEAVAKAVISSLESPCVFDATAGLGRDSLILQCCGANVTMFERNPIIWLMLADALRRAKSEINGVLVNGLPKLMPLGSLKFHMEHGGITTLPDVIYYDPMFPERRKSAKVKKEMQVFHTLAGIDDDTESFFKYLLGIALHHVTVKRPVLAAPLPSMPGGICNSVQGGTCRFDSYSTVNNAQKD